MDVDVKEARKLHVVAEDGNPDVGHCGGRIDEEKKGFSLGHGR